MTALDATESKSFVPLAEHPDIRVLFGSGTIEALGEEAAQDGILSAPPCPTIIWEKSKMSSPELQTRGIAFYEPCIILLWKVASTLLLFVGGRLSYYAE